MNDTKDEKKEDSQTNEPYALEREFANTTSFHRIYFWANSENNAQRIFWIFVVLGRYK